VLDAEPFFERRQCRRIEPPGRQRHAQFERLPLVMQAGTAADFDPLGGEPVRREPRSRLAFKRLDDRLQFRRRYVAQQNLPRAGEIVFDLGVKQPER